MFSVAVFHCFPELLQGLHIYIIYIFICIIEKLKALSR